MTERGWVVEPSPAPVIAISPGAPEPTPAAGSTAVVPARPPAALEVPVGGLPHLRATQDRKDRARAAERATDSAPGAAEVSNDLAATSGFIERAAPRDDARRSRVEAPARVVVDVGWSAAAPPAAQISAPAAPAQPPATRAAGLRGSALGSAPPPLPIAPPLRPVAATQAPAPGVSASAPASPPVSRTPARAPADSAPRAAAPTRAMPPVRPIAGAGGFPRSAAERAGAAARPARAAQPVPERRASIPARPPVPARVAAEMSAIEPPERIALGSVSTPLPTDHARLSRRPPTVELPTLDDVEPPVVVRPASAARMRASRPAPVAVPERALPSILSVIDRRHAPAGASVTAELPAARIIAPSAPSPAAVAVSAPAAPRASLAPETIALPEVTIEVEASAGPEPIELETSAPTERMMVGPGPEAEPVEPPAALAATPMPSSVGAAPTEGSIDRALHLDSLPPPAAAVRAPAPAPAAASSRPRQRRSASFSDADAAFFAAGEQMERGEADGLDDVDQPVPSLKRPPLWRRITGRHRIG